MADDQPKQGFGAKVGDFLNKFDKKVGPNDALAPTPGGNEPINGSKTGLTTASSVDNNQPAVASTTGEAATESETRAFDPNVVKVVYVLGGPGAGKGTQCARLVKDFDFVHLSGAWDDQQLRLTHTAGDLLRAEQNREGLVMLRETTDERRSEYGALIKDYIREGKIVPMEITIKLLENAMRDARKDGRGDRFPRKMDQAVKFDDTVRVGGTRDLTRQVCPATVVLFLTCPEKVLLERLLERGKTSGRDDDNEESIKKRFLVPGHPRSMLLGCDRTDNWQYEKQGKVLEVDSTSSVDDVYSQVRAGIEKRLGFSARSSPRS